MTDLSKMKAEIINRDALKTYFGKDFRNEIKILDKGEITRAVKIEGVKISKGAKIKLKKPVEV